MVEVRGICRENVRIERNDLTLRGRDPATDGVQGVAADPHSPALAFWYSNRATVENLSISDGPYQGLGAWYSDVTMTNCRVERNHGTGVFVSAVSSLTATGLVVSRNQTLWSGGIYAQREALVQLSDCQLEDNVPFGAFARYDAVLILSGKISGQKGVAVSSGAYVEVYCGEASESTACGIDVTEDAVSADGEGSTASLYDTAFRGSLRANLGARIDVSGGVQSLTPGRANHLWGAWLVTMAGANGATTSLGATHLDLFARGACMPVRSCRTACGAKAGRTPGRRKRSPRNG